MRFSNLEEAGGYYTQPVYDMIEKHGYEKVMRELLASLDADVIQDFITRADLDEGGEGSGPKHKEVTVTKDGKSKVVKKIAAKVFTDAGWKVEEGKSPHKKGTAKYKKHMAAMHAESKDEPIQVREAGSPWTTTGKHPEKMTTDELWAEIAVFDHIQDRGETLSPKDMMRLDSLFSYMDTAEMNEAIKRKADSMMESAMWKAKKQ
jgi:hypothetical protein